MRQVRTGGWRWGRAPSRQAQPILGAAMMLAALLALVAAIGCAPASRSGGTSSGTPTATSTATATPGPPTPTPTAQERIFITLVQQAVGNLAQDVGATYSAADGTATVTVVGPWSAPPVTDSDVSAAHEQVKTICFRAQKALWTSTSGIRLRQVTITVIGPIIDQYAERVPGAYGAAVLTAATAAQFHWDSLSPDGAWQEYDNVYLRPDYNGAD